MCLQCVQWWNTLAFLCVRPNPSLTHKLSVHVYTHCALHMDTHTHWQASCSILHCSAMYPTQPCTTHFLYHGLICVCCCCVWRALCVNCIGLWVFWTVPCNVHFTWIAFHCAATWQYTIQLLLSLVVQLPYIFHKLEHWECVILGCPLLMHKVLPDIARNCAGMASVFVISLWGSKRRDSLICRQKIDGTD